MEYLKTIHNKDPSIGQDSCIKSMYSCGRDSKNTSQISNVIGIIMVIVISSYLIHRFIQRPGRVSLGKVLDFATEQEVFKMFISLLLLTNIKTLSNSLIENIILPIVQPFLPFLSCNLKIKLGLFELGIGDFISDLLVFGINMYIIYFIFAIIY